MGFADFHIATIRQGNYDFVAYTSVETYIVECDQRTYYYERQAGTPEEFKFFVMEVWQKYEDEIEIISDHEIRVN